MFFSYDRIMAVFDVLNSVVIPVAGAVITWSELRDARREKRIRDFGKAGEVSPEERGEYVQQALELYSRYYAAEIARGEMVVRHLIYPAQWVQSAESDRFMRLSDLPVDITGTRWEEPPPRDRIQSHSFSW